jgi:hypothetical protein
MTDKIKSFDDLWNEAERRSLQVNKNDDSAYIVYEIQNLCSDIKDSVDPEALEILNKSGIKKPILTDQIGELLFMLTTITARENINIYEALKKYIDNL